MPARKPVDLHKRHNTKAEIAERKEAEAALHSERGLSLLPPKAIRKDKVAAATWRRLIREYSRLEAELISRLDFDLLVDYCNVMSQIDELDHMRTNSYEVWHFLNDQRKKFIEEKQFIEALGLVKDIQKSYDVIIKIDARLDAKRKLVFSIRQSMFMTPRSRSGVKPSQDPEQTAPNDPFEAKLNERFQKVAEKVNGGAGDNG